MRVTRGASSGTSNRYESSPLKSVVESTGPRVKYTECVDRYVGSAFGLGCCRKPDRSTDWIAFASRAFFDGVPAARSIRPGERNSFLPITLPPTIFGPDGWAAATIAEKSRKAIDKHMDFIRITPRKRAARHEHHNRIPAVTHPRPCIALLEQARWPQTGCVAPTALPRERPSASIAIAATSTRPRSARRFARSSATLSVNFGQRCSPGSTPPTARHLTKVFSRVLRKAPAAGTTSSVCSGRVSSLILVGYSLKMTCCYWPSRAFPVTSHFLGGYQLADGSLFWTAPGSLVRCVCPRPPA